MFFPYSIMLWSTKYCYEQQLYFKNKQTSKFWVFCSSSIQMASCTHLIQSLMIDFISKLGNIPDVIDVINSSISICAQRIKTWSQKISGMAENRNSLEENMSPNGQS